MKNRIKLYNVPALVMALLIIIGISGYLIYNYVSIFGDQNIAESQTEKTDVIKDDKKEETKEPVPDPTLINGTWKSEVTEDGVFLEFTIDYPEVTNFNGIKGMVYDSDNGKYPYMIILKDENGTSKFYLDTADKDNIKVVYSSDGVEFDSFIAISRQDDASGDPGNTIDEPQNKPANTGSSGNTASTGNNKPSNSGSHSGNSSSSSGKKGHWETRYETVPAWDEQVLVKEGYYENVLVKDAWDEADTYCYAFGQDREMVYVCNTCGGQFSASEIDSHIASHGGGGWHNDYIDVGEPYCKEYKTDYIHHDAVYDRVWHEPEYKTVHHPEETRSYQVWVDD